MYDYGVSNLAQGFFQGRQRAMDEQELERQRQRQAAADKRVEEEYAYTQRRRQVEDPLRDRTMAAQAQGAELGLSRTKMELTELEAGAPNRAAQRELDNRKLTYANQNFDAEMEAEARIKRLRERGLMADLSNAQLRGQVERRNLERQDAQDAEEKYIRTSWMPLAAALNSGDEAAIQRFSGSLGARGFKRDPETGAYSVTVNAPTDEVDEAGNPVTREMTMVGESPGFLASKIAFLQNPELGAKMMLEQYATRAASRSEEAKAAVEKLEREREDTLKAIEERMKSNTMLTPEQAVEQVRNERALVNTQFATRYAELGDDDGDGVANGKDPDWKGVSAAAPSGGWPAPNDRQISALRDNPDRAAEFDQRFGPGASQKYLGQQGN